MVISNLVLFGKHPAWSDHMFIPNDAPAGHYLKRVFYDHSVIPALQVGKGDQRISEEWSFLVFIDGHVFFIVNAASRDSVGRRRFPLIAAYSLPYDLKLEAALDKLKELKQELSSLLDEMLTASSEDLNQWQEAVTKTAESFQSKVDWSSVGSDEVRCELKRGDVASLMSRLSNDYDALDLKSCSFTESCGFARFGLKQFGSPIPALLILDQDYNGLGLFFAVENGSSFHLKRHLYGNLTALKVSEDNIPPKVSRLLNSLSASSESLLSIEEVPSLKLSSYQSFSTKEILTITISLVLVGLMLFGLINSCSSSDSIDQANISETDTEQLSTRQQWVTNATAYVEWIQPLIAFADETSTAPNAFDPIRNALLLDLNPFAEVSADEVSMHLAKNPAKQFLTSENSDGLEAVYANIDQLRTALTDYYEKQFSNELLKELKRQNYPQPSFVGVDFSQQPLLPSFGPELVKQLKSYTASRDNLKDIVISTREFWNVIIKPLHEVCPKHAKYTQRYVQNLIKDSDSLQQFQSQYTSLLKIFGYPDFIQINISNEDALLEDADWVNLFEQEASIESLHRLVELLEANQKDKSSSQPVPEAEISINATRESPGAGIEESFGAVTKSMGKAEDGLSEQLVSDLNSEEWNSFLEAELKQLQNNPLFSEIKDHADAIQLQVLGDTTLGSSQAKQKIQEQTSQLLKAFQRLNIESIKDASSLHSAYLKKRQNVKHLSDYVLAEYQAANISSGDVDSIDKISQEVRSEINELIMSLDRSFTDLKDIYFSNQSEDLNGMVDQKIYEITQNPLYFENGLGSQFEIIKTDVLDKTIAIETTQDLAWYVESFVSNDGITKARLNAVANVFDDLASDDPVNGLNELVRQAFNKYVEEIRNTNPEDLFDVYEDLNAYLPTQLHALQDKELEQIAAYWRRCSLDQDFEIPTKEEFERLKVSTESPKIREFYDGLLTGYDKVSFQSSGNTLDTIRKANGVKSVSVNEEDLRTEIIIEGVSEKLVFLPLTTEQGTVLVQKKPLSLEQYIKLSVICDFDTEYYLTLQDSFWPRSFEVGMGLGFSALNEWQFRNKDIFAPIDAFSRTTLPAHLNEPEQVLRMASFFGFRLLKPEECTAFVRLAKSSSLKYLEFSADDKEKLASANTIQSSVYAGLIAESIGRDEWSGGINFERYNSGADQFIDVIGGSAELAYDGVNFYAGGGSWLYLPLAPEEPVRITEPQRIYIDIGIRFVIEAPVQKFSAMVKKIALRILSESD